MLVCEILLRNEHLFEKPLVKHVSTLLELIAEHRGARKITVSRLRQIPTPLNFRKIGESRVEEFSPLHGRIELLKSSELFGRNNEFFVLRKTTTHWYDDFGTEATMDEEIVFFRIFGSFSEEDLLQTVFSQTGLFEAYHCPLYEVLADLLRDANELTVRIGGSYVFVEPWSGSCNPLGGPPLNLPFLALKILPESPPEVRA